MTRSLVGALALKDLYLTRWIGLGATVAGVLSLALAPLGPGAFYVGSISFLCVLIVLNIYLVLTGVTGEKKDKVRLFVLSLPISTAEYTLAKMAGNFAAFLLPWLALTAASLVVIAATSLPDGLMPIVLTLCVYLLAYYCVLLSVGIVSESQAGPGAAILIGNVLVNFAIPVFFRLPSGGTHVSGDTAVWGADVIAVIAVEIVVGLLALVLAFVHQSRRKDFV